MDSIESGNTGPRKRGEADSSPIERVPRKLVVLRLIRGLLVISLGEVYIALANFHIAYQTIIYGMPAYDPLFVILYTPLVFSSFGVGSFRSILETGYLVGLHEESNLNIPLIVVSFILEFIMIASVLIMAAVGALIVPGYQTFMYLATAQFLLFTMLVLLDRYFNSK